MAGTSSKGRLRLALFLAVGFAATGLALLAYGAHLFAAGSGWDVFGNLELSSVDTRFSIRGKQDVPPNIVVVKIDERTFGVLDEPWPFRRSLHARLMRVLKRAGAKVIAFDIQFSEQSVDPAQDNALWKGARAAGNVVFSTTAVLRGNKPLFVGGEAAVHYSRARVGNGNFDDDP